MAALPTTMREIIFDGAGGPDVIRLREAPVPAPGPGKVLVEVVAAGINRPDCIQRAGLYPPPPGETAIPGLEIAGRIVALGEGVSGLAVGDEICALVGCGGYAEYALADAALCLPRPEALEPDRGGGRPRNLFHRLRQCFYARRAEAGESFLVHGGSSGIGSTAIQLAKKFGAHGFRHGGFGGKSRFLPKTRRRSRRSIIASRILSPK